ncbi:hypothetical protein FHS85_003281 [Rhodoligotrophos appendicifer]|uniref:tripartite tricarboxylate transporter TctB family protein n=1 Tax=Rhodoligotrophos appendicifer TaxID=987056 RepID=UPI0011867BB3|nr:tripartite tricarboxylate transporter TctB family protein [Rhodoligotrophos appendicifer]
MQKSARDVLAGVIFIGFGAAFAIASLGYDLGTPVRMGPGYFPLVLAGVLVLLGLAIVGKSFLDAGAEAIGAVPWRAMALLISAPIVFGLMVKGAGLAPSLFVTVLMSAFASRAMTVMTALTIAAVLTVSCVAIFIYGLGITVPAIGPWLKF